MPKAASIIRRLRPLAQIVVDAKRAQAMSPAVQEALVDRVAWVLDQQGGAGSVWKVMIS